MRRTVLLVNCVALVALISLRQYARGYHSAQAQWAYDAFVSRGLLDDAKAQEYARAHNGWHPKLVLAGIGNPDGFVQDMFLVGIAAIAINSVALLLRRGAAPTSAELGTAPNGGSTSPLTNSGDSDEPPSVR